MKCFQKAVSLCSGMLLVGLLLLNCQTSADKKGTEPFLQEHIEWLSSDERAGRLAGSQQEAAAANYISDFYLQAGLLPFVDSESYIQQFVLNGPMVQALGMENHISRNVVGAVEGTEYPGRFIIVGAHYDGQGKGGIISMETNTDPVLHNSADDNASGTAGLMWLAGQFAENPAKSTVIFAAFSGEEMGLLGSEYFADQMVMPRDSVLAMINLDMIGRLDDGQLSIFGTGTANIWDDLIEGIPADSLRITKIPDGMGSSDHASFSRTGIPVLHYFTGTHEDYHRPTDTADKINYRGMEWVLNHTKQTIRSLDNYHPSEILFNEAGSRDRSPTVLEGVTLGVVPDYNFSGAGFRIAEVRSGSLAEESGIQDGDVIFRMNEDTIADIYSYMETLSGFSDGDDVIIYILRNGSEIDLAVQF